MNAVLFLKGVVACGVPFFTALTGALAPYAMDGASIPDSKVKQVIICLIVSGAAVTAGLSGLGSFLSTSYSDHKAQMNQDAVNKAAGLPAGLPPVPPAVSPSTPAPVAATVVPPTGT